jgi:hypothetical protein
MNNFKEIKQNFLNMRKEFNNNVKDKFGSSVDSEIFEPTFNCLNLLSLQEDKIEVESKYIKSLILEAQAILPII